MKFYCRLILLILSVHSFVNVFSQNATEKEQVNHQVWIDFYPHYYVNDKVEYYGDTGFRTIIGERSWNRLYIRPSIKYHLTKKWEIHTGLGLFYIYNINDFDQFEVTPWQGVQFNGNESKKLNFKHLFKVEERWVYLSTGSKMNFEFRLRYKLSGRIKLKNNWSIPFYGEMFLPLTGKFDELYQNKGRAGLGVAYKISEKWKVSFIGNWQRSKSGIGEEVNVSDYIYQIKIKKVWSPLIKLK